MSDEEEIDDQISDQPAGWSSSSNDCFHITLLHPSGEHTTFQPQFTYPIFGEQEAIFGYQDLEILLTFAAHTLEPRLEILHGAVYEEQGEIKPTDIKAAIQDFLPSEAFLNTRISFDNARDYVPPGERVRAYRRDGKQYEIRCASLQDVEAKKLLNRMQILVPLFIEGGTMLQLEQEWTTNRWKLFTLWQVEPGTTCPYSLIGYSTSYRVFTMDKSNPGDIQRTEQYWSDGVASPLQLPSRERLSQFLILDSFQGQGHGQELYRAVYKHLTADDNVCEFTVEDPNEQFDDLRDFCDLTYLRSQTPKFTSLEINTEIPAAAIGNDKTVPIDQIISKEVREDLRTQSKIETRQFNRMVEMNALMKIPANNRSRARLTRREKATNKHDRAYYFWRMYVKQRLLIFNEDALTQLDHEERVEKLEGAVDSNQEHYLSIIEKVQKREAAGIDIHGDDLTITNGGASSSLGKRGRTRVLDDDEDDDMDIVSNTSKRGRVA